MGWLAKRLPKAIRNFRFNAQLKSPHKLQVGDEGYTLRKSRASSKLSEEEKIWLKDTVDYYKKYNPKGYTISDYEKLYSKQIASGLSLKQAMDRNPSGTMNYYALIDDTEDDDTTTTTTDNDSNKKMAFNFAQYGVNDPDKYGDTLAGRQHNIDKIFQNVVGRNADPKARGYWGTQAESLGDQGYQDLVNTLLASDDYKDRSNPNYLMNNTEGYKEI